jgi:hypothetical protein
MFPPSWRAQVHERGLTKDEEEWGAYRLRMGNLQQYVRIDR